MLRRHSRPQFGGRPPISGPGAGDDRHPWLIGLIAVLTLAPVLTLLATRLSAPADGTFSQPSQWTARGVEITDVSGQPGDLREGDVVVAVDGVALDDWVTATDPLPLRAGDTVIYRVHRANSPIPTDVLVTLVAYPFGAVLAAAVWAVPLLILLIVLAAYVFLQRPGDRAARALYVTTVFVCFGLPAWPFGAQIIDFVNGPRVWPVITGGLANTLAWGALLTFVLSFPEPRVVLARHGWTVALICAVPLVLHAGYLALNPSDTASNIERLARWVDVSSQAGLIMPLIIVAAFIWQFRSIRSPADRQRMRWTMITVGICAVLYLGIWQMPDKFAGHPLLPWAWLALVWAIFPLVLAAAVLRYQLFDIQFVLHRSLVYGSLTVTLIGVYLGIVALLSQVTGSEVSAAPLVAGATVALLFQPLRRWLRQSISRVFFGDRDDPNLLLDRLGQQLQEAAAPTAILDGIARTVAQALRLPYVAVELTDGDTAAKAASYGVPTGQEQTVLPLTNGGVDVGRLVLETAPATEPFGPADQQLLERLCHQIAATAHNVTLSIRLQRTLGEVITAREEERRRLRRDVHDGIGPLLAAGKIRLQVARKLLHTNPDSADEILRALTETQQLIITDIRQLVDNLRPAILDQLGLVEAIRQRADTFGSNDQATMQIDVDADLHSEVLPAAVEVAAYRITVEALTNAAKHAHAGQCRVRIWRHEGLHLQIDDNGVGIPPTYRAGVGLASIRERATELGGEATVEGRPQGGTRVSARLPLNIKANNQM